MVRKQFAPSCLCCVLLRCTKVQGTESISQSVALSFLVPPPTQFPDTALGDGCSSCTGSWSKACWRQHRARECKQLGKMGFYLQDQTRKTNQSKCYLFHYCKNQLQVAFCLKSRMYPSPSVTLVWFTSWGISCCLQMLIAKVEICLLFSISSILWNKDSSFVWQHIS